MQLAVIDDLIEQQKTIINKYPDNAPKAIAYLSGFIDCARQAQVGVTRQRGSCTCAAGVRRNGCGRQNDLERCCWG